MENSRQEKTSKQEKKEMNHPLHMTMGDLMSKILQGIKSREDIEIVKDPACESKRESKEKQHIPLFRSEKHEKAGKYCNVDMLILKKRKIKIIVEIEESNVKPTQICGKYLTSALSKYFIHKKQNVQCPMDKPVLFIQILDTSKLSERSAKRDQWERIEESIRTINGINEIQYKLFSGESKDFTGKTGQELEKLVKDFLK
jgi:hypothetical protein